jgi:large subunit ribosomal protein L21
MKYAVVRTGGKQYRVAPGDVISVEKLDGDVGDTVELSEVLLAVGDSGLQVGRPVLEGARVSAEIVEQGKQRKVLIFKYKRRKRYRRKTGHRQPFTGLKIGQIAVEGSGQPAQPAAEA